MSSAQVRPISSTLDDTPIRQSASFAAHLKTIERKIPLRARYENFIGGEWMAPVKGGYFDNISPTTGDVICRIARSQADDVERAIDAAHAAADGWGRTALPITQPEKDLPPDRPPSVVPEHYPSAFIPPFHYRNPATGR